MWPEASKPVIVPAVNRLQGIRVGAEEGSNNADLQGQDPIPSGWGTSAVIYSISRYKASPMAIQRRYLHVAVNTSLAERNPYVFDTPIGSQMRHSRKSTKYNPTENLNTNEYILGGR